MLNFGIYYNQEDMPVSDQVHTPGKVAHEVENGLIDKKGSSFSVNRKYKKIADKLHLTGNRVFLLKARDINRVIPVGEGILHLAHDSYILVIESGDRTFLKFDSECTLNIDLPNIEIDFNHNNTVITVGIRNKDNRTIRISENTADILNCISYICSMPSERSPFKSHPLFRHSLPRIDIAKADRSRSILGPDHADIVIRLPEDLKYIYSASPLAYYLGAALETDKTPSIELKGHDRIRLSKWPEFETDMAGMIRLMFNMDCAVRCAAMTGKYFHGIDLLNLFDRSPTEIFSMSMQDRLALYSGVEIENVLKGIPVWHMASYLNPLPASVRSLPLLLPVMSAIHSARSYRLTDRDAIMLSIKKFLSSHAPAKIISGPVLGHSDKNEVCLPVLYDARSNHWPGDGYPVDAIKSGLSSSEYSESNYTRPKRKRRVAIICNDEFMKEAVVDICEPLSKTDLKVDLLMKADVEDVKDTFASGYGLVQFIGRHNAQGFMCADGFVKASDMDVVDASAFFLCTDSSYEEGACMVRKSSTCGIATLFPIYNEAALDVLKNFYIMIAAGYSVYTSIQAAKECSVEGKKYIFLGDNSCRGPAGAGSYRRFYRIDKDNEEFLLDCMIDGVEKGSIEDKGNYFENCAVSDMGFIMRSLSGDRLGIIGTGLQGYCLYDGNIYKSVKEAAYDAVNGRRKSL
ncbi:hypothetical protein CUJ83_05700 [Methanocella sp. CWC-04]|uniref:Uncharacterized protein n=1 Tax=Methanooceanicella nereidis TaxID=2052831 RepID=A0AAP2W5N2_9EURY|nr:hypothetical protein [Methanocella sp. CWC-04]MCD1294493.1 hypothetical protein [Methanocella sp. CWC-04]